MCVVCVVGVFCVCVFVCCPLCVVCVLCVVCFLCVLCEFFFLCVCWVRCVCVCVCVCSLAGVRPLLKYYFSPLPSHTPPQKETVNTVHSLKRKMETTNEREREKKKKCQKNNSHISASVPNRKNQYIQHPHPERKIVTVHSLFLVVHIPSLPPPLERKRIDVEKYREKEKEMSKMLQPVPSRKNIITVTPSPINPKRKRWKWLKKIDVEGTVRKNHSRTHTHLSPWEEKKKHHGFCVFHVRQMTSPLERRNYYSALLHPHPRLERKSILHFSCKKKTRPHTHIPFERKALQFTTPTTTPREKCERERAREDKIAMEILGLSWISSLSLFLSHSHPHSHILTHSYSHTLTNSQTHTLTHSLTHSHTHTLTHSHTHTLTHSHTHTHTHTLKH